MKKELIMAFGSHPDDVEAGCGGTLALLNKQNFESIIVDMSQGEAGAGTVKQRQKEARNAQKILGSKARINLNLPDSKMSLDQASILKVRETLKTYKPEIILLPYGRDIHRDHIVTTKIIENALFEERLNGYNPQLILYYILDYFVAPTLIIDITNTWEIKVKSLEAHESQIESDDYDRFICKPFATTMGQLGNCAYGEGFLSQTPLVSTNIVGFSNLLLLS